MLKIKDVLLKRLYRYNLSKFAFVVLLDIISIADDMGKVGIYYRDIFQQAGCSRAQFYNVIRDLESVGIIQRKKNPKYKDEILIEIHDNDFQKSGYRDYVNTDITFFAERLYKDMKAGEIRLYLYFLFRIVKQKNNKKVMPEVKNKLRYNDSYAKISERVGISQRMTKQYCESLLQRGYICIAKKLNMSNKKYDIITLNKSSTKEAKIQVMERGIRQALKPHELHFHWRYFIQGLCRRMKILYDLDALNDAAMLFSQYRKKAQKQGKDIYGIIKDGMMQLSGILDGKSLHSIIKNLINIDYNNSVLAYQ